MNLNEKRLRVGGYLVLTAIFFIFFMLEMFFTWHDKHMLAKVLAITIPHTLLIWEPTRKLILVLRRRCPALKNVRRRLVSATAVLVPYAGLIGFARIYLEDRTNLWGLPVANLSNYSHTIGITLLFVLLQLAVYESNYFFREWNKSRNEAEELKQLHVQMQIDILKVKIQPHFLFNTLNTLIGLIEADKTRAVTFTEDLAYVYRYLLEANDRLLIGLDEELAFTEKYFSLLKTRYPEGLYLETDIRRADAFEVPPLSLQVLVENAVKHNIVTRARPLHIHLKLDPRTDRIIIRNNVQPRADAEKTGRGLAHLRKKFELLNLSQIHVTGSPTAFLVSLPLIQKYIYESADY